MSPRSFPGSSFQKLPSARWTRSRSSSGPRVLRAECPECGFEMVLPRVYEVVECERCGAHLSRKSDEESELVTQSEKVGLTEVEAQTKWRRDHPDYYAPSTFCDHCHAPITIEDPRFCPSCGASLATQRKKGIAMPSRSKPKIRKRSIASTRQTEKCIVCNLELGRKDDVVWCPHCGRLAHRNHLIKWISRKSTCPVCGEYLSERDYE